MLPVRYGRLHNGSSIVVSGVVVFLILIVLLLRRAIRDVKRPGKYIQGPQGWRRPESIP